MDLEFLISFRKSESLQGDRYGWFLKEKNGLQREFASWQFNGEGFTSIDECNQNLHEFLSKYLASEVTVTSHVFGSPE